VTDGGRVVRIAARGEGVTADGRFVALAATGDEVLADGKIVHGPGHAVPPCRHFPDCGGCQLQHVNDTAYGAYIIERIAGALKSQGIEPPLIRQPHISPPLTRRRATMRAERRGKAIVIGFNEGASNRIVDLRECHVLLPELFALISPLRALFLDILPERVRSSVTLTRADQGIDTLLAGFEVSSLENVEALTHFAERHQLARLSLDEGYGPVSRAMPQPVTVTFNGTSVALPDGAFLQATHDGEATLVEAVREALDGASTIVDLFAGLGTFALSLPAKVMAVEGSRDAALALKATHRVAVEHRDLFRRPLTAEDLLPFEGAVIDPPRAGAKEQIAELAQSRVARIAYVSCNPATFARDAKTLTDSGYRLEWIRPVGQFRWSTHVELAAAFVRQ
jgi:23S rRNA (uracil1939-C5)-methyltransferase